MRKNLLGSMFLAAGLLFGQAVHAADAPANEVIISAADFEKEQAVVVSVDPAARNIVLAMPNGRLLEFTDVNKKVELDKAKPGDIVNVAGSQAIALLLHKGGAGVRSIVESSGSDATANGVATLITRTVRNDIVSVDMKKGEAVVRNVPGELITIAVPDKALLAKAAAGDQLWVVTRLKAVIWGQ